MFTYNFFFIKLLTRRLLLYYYHKISKIIFSCADYTYNILYYYKICTKYIYSVKRYLFNVKLNMLLLLLQPDIYFTCNVELNTFSRNKPEKKTLTVKILFNPYTHHMRYIIRGIICISVVYLQFPLGRGGGSIKLGCHENFNAPYLFVIFHHNCLYQLNKL